MASSPCGIVPAARAAVNQDERPAGSSRGAFLPLLHKYIGDPTRAEDRRRLEAISPLFKADRVQRPVLLIHGARDVRVNVRESEQMAEALRKNSKDVRLLVFPDEGHRRDYGNWRNTLRHYREIEDFLASCVGGRRSGIVYRLGVGTVAPDPPR